MRKKIWPLAIFLIFVSHHSSASVVATFQGEINFAQHTVTSVIRIPTIENESPDKDTLISLKAWQNAAHAFRLTINVERLNTPLFNISTQIDTSLESSRVDEGKWNGKIWTQYSLLNYKPTQEIAGEFSVENHQINLKNITLGNIDAHGIINLKDPFDVDLYVNLNDIGMHEFINFWTASEEFDSDGDVSGEIRIIGYWNNLFLKGKLLGGPGYVEELKFDSIALNISGVYPNMVISPSAVSQTEGMNYIYQGPIDLSDHVNFEKHIRALKIDPVVNTSKSEMEWTLKNLKRNNDTSTELKYIRKKGIDTDTNSNNQTELWGIERKVEF